MKKVILALVSIFLSFSIYAKSLDDYQNEAENGDENSAFKLGMIYEFGIAGKVDKNMNQAVRYYTMAHDGGNVRASGRLGVINYDRANYKKALEYLKIGAEKNEGLSEAYLGKILEKNNKIDSALKFYDKSVKNNNPYGKMFMGEYYIKTAAKGSDDFIKGYALLVSANKQNEEAKRIINRYPYKFNKKEQETLKNYMSVYK